MINNLINTLFSSLAHEEGKTQVRSLPVVEPEENTVPAQLPPSAQYDDPEYTVLAQKYGILETGRTIETTLTDLLSILPRRRQRVDAYGALVKKLAADGITLKITSRRTKP